jgi:peptide-methionine (S)-S-oxide reductase
MNEAKKTQLATFGGGCFWCTEAVFQELKGVIGVKPGYAGGHTKNPTYREVCSGTTGHAEVIQIEYDPNLVPFEKLLEVFFQTHDPTTLNRQGNDIGTQYRSVIFYHNDQQRKISEQIIQRLAEAKVFRSPIVTQLEKLDVFYEAEDYHHDYFSANPDQPYCEALILPKLKKFRKVFAEDLKETKKKD